MKKEHELMRTTERSLTSYFAPRSIEKIASDATQKQEPQQKKQHKSITHPKENHNCFRGVEQISGVKIKSPVPKKKIRPMTEATNVAMKRKRCDASHSTVIPIHNENKSKPLQNDVNSSAWMIALALSDSALPIDANRALQQVKNNKYSNNTFQMKRSSDQIFQSNRSITSISKKDCLDTTSLTVKQPTPIDDHVMREMLQPVTMNNACTEKHKILPPKNVSWFPFPIATIDTDSSRSGEIPKTCNRPKCMGPFLMRSKNIVHQLMNRSTNGNRYRIEDYTRLNQNVVTPRICQNKILQSTPKMVPWLELLDGTKALSFNTLNRNSGDLACFDDEGVLLAVSSPHDQCIRIFDWDTVVAADLRGRNTVCSDRNKTFVLSIEPIITLGMSAFVSSENPTTSYPNVTMISWNPFHQDELIIGSRSTASVYIVDLSLVNDWLQKPLEQRGAMPYKKLFCGDGEKLSKLSKVLFFESGRYIIITTTTSILCWYYDTAISNDNLEKNQAKLLWTFSPWQHKFQSKNIHSITSIACVSPELILVGSSDGDLALINWKKMQKATSFSTTLCPKIVLEWKSYHGLSCDVPKGMMGLRYLQVHHTNGTLPQGLQTGFSTDLGPYDWLQCKVTWGTECGWIITMIIELKRSQNNGLQVKRNNPTILFNTRPVRCVNSEGSEVRSNLNSWSLPTGDGIQMNETPTFGYIWEKVPVVTQVIDNRSDLRIAGSQQPMSFHDTSEKPGFHWYQDLTALIDNTSLSPLSFPISKRVGRPTFVAVHPSNQWLIIGTSSYGLTILDTRRKS